jgi:hypothetical protein
MTALPMRELNTQAAKELAEYILLQSDLKTALSMMALYFDKYAGAKDIPEQEQDLVLSIFRDAITNFIACFDPIKGAKGIHLDRDVIYGKTNGGLEFFAWMKDIRDSYAAHRFGPHRQCLVGVILGSDGKVIGTGHMKMIYSGPIADAKGEMLSFISIAGKYVDSKIRELGEMVVKEANLLTAEQLAALPVAQIRAPDPGDIRTSRAAFQRAVSSRRPNLG